MKILLILFFTTFILSAKDLARIGEISVSEQEVNERIDKWLVKVGVSDQSQINKHKFTLCNMLINRRVLLQYIPSDFQTEFKESHKYDIDSMKQLVGEDAYKRSKEFFMLSDRIILNDFIEDQIINSYFTIKFGDSISDAIIKDFYDKNKALYFTDVTLDYNQIFISGSEDAVEDIDKYQVITNLRASLNKDNFEEIAKSKSECAITKSKGGLLTGIKANAIPVDLAKALVALKPGEITNVIKVDTDYYILRLNKAVKSTIPFDQLKNKLKSFLIKKRINKEIIDYLNSYKKDKEFYIFCNAEGDISK